jgi:hypothetical protein
MRRITLEIYSRERASTEVLLELFDNARSIQGAVLEKAFQVFKPKALDFIWYVRLSDNVADKPHELAVDFRTSFVDADFETEDMLTPLGNYLKVVEGYIYEAADEDCSDPIWASVVAEHFWNPEWPHPLRIKIAWEYNSPYCLSVFYEADDDAQFAHLITHGNLDDLLNGMVPILEEYLNQRVQEILQPDRVHV